ncbi:outer membrane beta-barrel protein [Bradyrhizobium sp. 170]|uniref:outer membrane protein n=1 Tax=Bradyrhizobium sp. 170 TaxID=2782641 RepID=UPI0020461856|nr:outer membrane beta-barrel protein [Bradyrhizobium sp. 170]UPK03929.1 porin family protein [Bradyrhizobium sp. 170]
MLAASAAGASAADMPLKASPIVAAGLDWSGVYIGAHAGYGGGMKDWESNGPADFVARGPLVGGQVGINKQLGSVVFGLELDGSWADIKGTGVSTMGGAAFGTVETRATSKIDSLVTFAGRAGIAADRWFVFAKGGITAAHEKHDYLVNVNAVLGGVPLIQSASLSGSETRYAPMLGFGAEYALVGPWSILAEYNYHHFGAGTSRLTGQVTTNGVTTPFAANNRIEQSIHVARLGVNYRFGGIAPDPSFAPVPAAPGTNWTGAYIGAQGGYGWGQTQWPDVFGIAPGTSLPRFDNSSWLAGGTIGVNAQVGRFVFGVEGEILATDIKGNAGGSTVGGFLDTTYTSKIDWLALASARAGFVVGDKLMLYGKGGLAIAEEQHTAVATQSLLAVSINYAGKAVHTGAVIGAGGEYAFAPNWSVKAEYDYIKMFAQQVQLQGTAVGGPFGAGVQISATATKVTQDLHLVKFGVNYHFNP